MADVNVVLDANHDAVRELVASAERCEKNWTTAPAPGKWSPSQIVEHVARTLDESANLFSGQPTKFLTLPFFLRPLVKSFLFKRVLRTRAFPKARTNKAMNPATGPATPADARARLKAALARFDRECRACDQKHGSVVSGAFGTVTVVDYADFIAVHTRHHCRQM